MMLSGLVVFAGLKKEKAYAIPEDFIQCLRLIAFIILVIQLLEYIYL